MSEERKNAIIEDVVEATTLEELDALVKDLEQSEPDALKDDEVQAMVSLKLDTLGAPVVEPPVVAEKTIEELQAELAAIQAKLASIPPVQTEPRAVSPKVVSSVPVVAKKTKVIRYRLLSTNVGWSTVPQVHALMAVLVHGLELKVGDVFTNEQAIAAAELNVKVLNTKQTGKRIWDYYKGNSAEGLMAHGVIEKL